SVPKKNLRVCVEDPLKQPWAAGYSGWLGVATCAIQLTSGSVSVLPSVSPARIAVTGRQKLYVYFESQHAIMASALAVDSIAKKRALSSSDSPCVIAMLRHARFHWRIGWSDQKRPISVCSGLRVLPVAGPRFLTSL